MSRAEAIIEAMWEARWNQAPGKPMREKMRGLLQAAMEAAGYEISPSEGWVGTRPDNEAVSDLLEAAWPGESGGD